MRKALFVNYVSLNPSLVRLYSLDFLFAQGIVLEYWDISAIFGHAPLINAEARPYVRRFQSWEAFRAALKTDAGPEAIVIVGFAFEPRTYRVYRLLSETKARLGFVTAGVLPDPCGHGERDVRGWLSLILNPAKVAHYLLKRTALAARRAGYVRDFDLMFVAGDAARDEALSPRRIPINFCDYDDWLEMQAGDSPLVARPYAVYLDQFAPSHPDLKISGITKLIDPVRYYSRLNDFFSRLEKRHGVEIVVAAHPKSDYPVNPFAGREIFRSSTRQLVRRCAFAINNSSTSMSYAILDRKPLVFFTTDDIADCYRPIGLDIFTPFCARILGRPCVNLDHPAEDDELILPVDPRLYDDYKYRYLVSRETEERLSRDIYLEFFRREFGAREEGAK